MADRYTLPAEMGGHECTIIEGGLLDLNGLPACRIRYAVRDLLVTTILPWSLLTPVKPPLPRPEPIRCECHLCRAVWAAANQADKAGEHE